jgi:hypothetical protein
VLEPSLGRCQPAQSRYLPVVWRALLGASSRRSRTGRLGRLRVDPPWRLEVGPGRGGKLTPPQIGQVRCWLEMGASADFQVGPDEAAPMVPNEAAMANWPRTVRQGRTSVASLRALSRRCVLRRRQRMRLRCRPEARARRRRGQHRCQRGWVRRGRCRGLHRRGSRMPARR